ncbi:hypothetical protein H7271_05655 [Bittarella massiliensis]|uniref:polysialyltransferase family glycosyltransferase n=1 Tax=Bittarella massiliensis (ex Durand et al. 2017) TaxID=1720313 RepID=UPI00163B8183|nr:polysialyltransferase family glycosyltransferase [Bittarella massiliensis (ex Durand et al. 2017)]MBC2871089.1 hypothetical protein [Bittarella massiliensis (ex Durand et al. 2017)]
MIAFLCATPYQIFNCVALKTTLYSDEKADLYLLTHTSDISMYFSRLKASHMFSNIYVINAFRHPSNMWNTMKDFLFLDKSLSNVLNKKFYKILLGTCIGVINSVFYSKLYKNNPDLRFFYYDEGIGIYCTPLIEASTKLKFFIRSIGGRDYFESISGLYAYMPKAILTNRQFPGYCIPAVSLERQELFNCIFAYSGEAEFYKDKTFVYLDQAYKKQLNIDIDNGKLLTQICRVVCKSQITLRLHPTRMPDDQEYSGNSVEVAPAVDIPWEVLLLNMDLQNKVFISINSTACITSKMVFDQEPFVILLYELVPECMAFHADGGKTMKMFFEKIRCSYRNPERFFIPKTFDELHNVLESISKEVQ